MERPFVQAPDTFYPGAEAIRPRAPFPGACPPAMNGGNQTAGKPGSASAGPAQIPSLLFGCS